MLQRLGGGVQTQGVMHKLRRTGRGLQAKNAYIGRVVSQDHGQISEEEGGGGVLMVLTVRLRHH